ncbi:MAG: ParB/RepB/Spo0J family partition protein [Chthoniobacteraceae bacterium]
MNWIPYENLTEEQKQAVQKKWERMASESGNFDFTFFDSGAPNEFRMRSATDGKPVSERPPTVSMEAILRVPRAVLLPSPLNPRKTFSPEYLGELAASIRANGILNAILVRPWKGEGKLAGIAYEIVAGECRWRASELAGLDQVPVVVRDISDVKMLELMLTENMKRQDLTPLEEMAAFARMLEQRDEAGAPIYNQTRLAEKIGVAENYVRQRLMLSRLTAVGRKALTEGKLSFSTARVICQCPASVVAKVEDEVLHPKKYDQWCDSDEPLTAEEATEVIQERYIRDLSKPPFELSSPSLIPVHTNAAGERLDGGPCTDCPWNSANQADGQEQARTGKRGRPSGSSKYCLNVPCFSRKVEINVASRLEKAKANGAKILSDKEAEKVVYESGQLRYGTPYVKLSEKPGFEDLANGVKEKKVPTWKKLVSGESAPPLVIAVDGHGHIHELVERKLALEAARLNGNEKLLSLGSGRGRSLQEEDVKAQKKAEREKQRERERYSNAVMAALVGAVEEEGAGGAAFWEAMRAIARRHAGSVGCIYFCKRRGIDRGKDVYDVVFEALKKKENSALAGMIVELLFAQDWAWAQSPNAGGNEVPDNALPLLKHYEIDLAAIKKQVKEEAKAEAEAKKMPKGKAKKAKKDEQPVAAAAEPSESIERVKDLPDEDWERVVKAIRDAGVSGIKVKEISTNLHLPHPRVYTMIVTKGIGPESRIEKCGPSTFRIKQPAITPEEIESLMTWCAEKKVQIDRLPKAPGVQPSLLASLQEELGLDYDSALAVCDRFVDWRDEKSKNEKGEL